MATIQVPHTFVPTKQSKDGLGILVVDNQYKFRLNKKNKNHYTMYCTMYSHPSRCQAKAKVVKKEDGTFFLCSVDRVHCHFSNRAEIEAEHLKQQMELIVENEPMNPVGDAIREVKLTFYNQYENDSDFVSEVIDALGSQTGLEKRLYRKRNNLIGAPPTNREDFDPINFIDKIYRENSGVRVLDSNSVEDWGEILSKVNKNSPY